MRRKSSRFSLFILLVFVLLHATSGHGGEDEDGGDITMVVGTTTQRLLITPIFEVEFNAESGAGGYRRFIENLRDQLRSNEPSQPHYSHNRPVLVPQLEPPTRWFDVVVRTDDHRVRLRIRADNLYLYGFQADNGQWFEFGRMNQANHVFPGSTFIGFGHRYQDMANNGGPLVGTNYGPYAMINAANALGAGQATGEALAVMVVMICESTRLMEVFESMAGMYHLSETATLTGRLDELIHSWQPLSLALLEADYHAQHFPAFRQLGIDSADQAAASLGIVLNCIGRPGNRRDSIALAANDRDLQCMAGRRMLEIFELLVIDIDGENPGDLYGTVVVKNGFDEHHIYDRKRSDYESIRPMHKATLSGPAQGITTLGEVTIYFDLKDKDADWSPDDEVAKGRIDWSPVDATNVYDSYQMETIKGGYGSVQVKYAVLSNAVEAAVQVVLINGDQEDPADIYGKIAARNTITDQESVLFMRNSNQDVLVRPWGEIPLSRSVVAVPIDASFLVQAELWDRDRDLSPDDEVAKGTARFTPELNGQTEAYISGKYGLILVKLTWRVPVV